MLRVCFFVAFRPQVYRYLGLDISGGDCPLPTSTRATVALDLQLVDETKRPRINTPTHIDLAASDMWVGMPRAYSSA